MAWLHPTCHHNYRLTNLGSLYDLRLKSLDDPSLSPGKIWLMLPCARTHSRLNMFHAPKWDQSIDTFENCLIHICLMLNIHNATWRFTIFGAISQLSAGVCCLPDIIGAFEHGDLLLCGLNRYRVCNYCYCYCYRYCYCNQYDYYYYYYYCYCYCLLSLLLLSLIHLLPMFISKV